MPILLSVFPPLRDGWIICITKKEAYMDYGDKYMRAKDCARFLGIGTSTWWRWVNEGKVDEGERFSARVRVWKLSTVKKAARLLAQANSLQPA